MAAVVLGSWRPASDFSSAHCMPSGSGDYGQTKVLAGIEFETACRRKYPAVDKPLTAEEKAQAREQRRLEAIS